MMWTRVLRSVWSLNRMHVLQPGSGSFPCDAAVSVDEALAAEAARYAAQTANDFAAMEQLFSEDLVYIHSSTVVDTKTSFIESMRSGAVRYHRMALGDVTVRCYGGLAVISGRTGFEVTARGQALTMDLLFHALWAKRASGLQFISWQATRVPAQT
jgi:hypothetical protein